MTESRLLRAIHAIVDAFTERTKCHVKVRYRVVSAAGDRYNLQAVKTGVWPDIVPCAVMGGAPGYKANLALGSTVLVEFIEGEISLPFITAFEQPGAPGFVPLSVKICLDGASGPAAARVGDMVQSLVAPGPITGTITIAGTPSPFVGTFATPLQVVGTIQTGSTRVTIG